MRKRTLLLVLLLAMLCIGVNAEEIKLTDFEGREVTLSKPAERIIALMPGIVKYFMHWVREISL